MAIEGCTALKYIDIQFPFLELLGDYSIETKNNNEISRVADATESENTMPLEVDTVFDDDLKIYTVGVKETGLYGEGQSFDKAYEDLIDNIIELTRNIKNEKINDYFDTEYERKVMTKILWCDSDRFKIRKQLYLNK